MSEFWFSTPQRRKVSGATVFLDAAAEKYFLIDASAEESEYNTKSDCILDAAAEIAGWFSTPQRRIVNILFKPILNQTFPVEPFVLSLYLGGSAENRKQSRIWYDIYLKVRFYLNYNCQFGCKGTARCWIRTTMELEESLFIPIFCLFFPITWILQFTSHDRRKVNPNHYI